MSSVLDIAQAACYEMNIPAPTSLISSSDPAVLQLKHLLLSCGRELVGAKCWPQLKKTHSFNTVAGTSLYDLPSDFEASLLETYWDRTSNQQMGGPLTDAEMSRLNSGTASAGDRFYFRIFNAQFEVYPAPSTTVHALSFEYISNAWILSSEVWGDSILTDFDTQAFDEDLMIIGLKLRWYQHKGLNFMPFKEQWDSSIDYAQSRWQGNRKVSLSPAGASTLNIPEGSFAL